MWVRPGEWDDHGHLIAKVEEEEWAKMARFVLPDGMVGHAIQGQLTHQRLRDLRVTHFTSADLRAAVDLLHREEFAQEVLRGEHDERETSDE